MKCPICGEEIMGHINDYIIRLKQKDEEIERLKKEIADMEKACEERKCDG